MFTVLDEQEEDMSGEPLEPHRAAVEFSHVDFAYAPGHPVLRDFTLQVPPGKKVALVGAADSGKTTVVNLLRRIFESADIHE